jgi:hypothetical protein
MKTETIGISELCRRLALSPTQIARERKDGMPHEPSNGSTPMRFPWPACRVWRDEHIRAKAEASAAKAAADPKRRKLAAQADLAELELAKRRAELMTVAQYTRLVADTFGRVRAILLAMPPRLAAAGVGHQNERDAQAALDPLVYEVIDELHQAKDVPALDGVAGAGSP